MITCLCWERIKQNLDNYEYCDDQDVIDVVQKEINELENLGESWVLQGFPRTKY